MSDSPIHSWQPLEPFADTYLQVTIIEYVYVEGDDTPEEVGSTFVMVDGKATRTWLESIKDYDRKVEYVPITVFSGPKAVHAHDQAAHRSLCDISNQRLSKYNQSVEQAFFKTLEKPTCERCERVAKRLGADLASYQGIVLKPWDWANVDPDYRPGGKNHRFNRPSYGRAGK